MFRCYPTSCHLHGLVWLSGNALVSINVVTLRQARLVPGWVHDCVWTGRPPGRRTRHPDLLNLSLLSVGMQNEYLTKLGKKTATSRDTLSRIRGLAVCAGVWRKD